MSVESLIIKAPHPQSLSASEEGGKSVAGKDAQTLYEL